MNFLKKTNKEEALYKSGYDDAERKLILIWRQKLSDLENEKDEEIEALKFEITRLEIQLKNWRTEHKQGQEDKIMIRQEKSLIKREHYKISKFKEEVMERLSVRLNEDTEEIRDIMTFLDNQKFEQIEN
ncbi:MAG: hypothetical protein ACFFC1_05620 [Promethearchaeota archaeon]